MFDTVLLASDLSAASDVLIADLAAVACLGVKRAICFHGLGIASQPGMESSLAGFVEGRLAQQVERIRSMGLEAQGVISPGCPFVEILSVAKDKKASFLMVGSHGAGLCSEIFLGSMTQRVMRRATLPLLVMRTNQPSTDRPLNEHILFATDFSQNARKAWDILTQIKGPETRKITLLYVEKTPRILSGPGVTATEHIQDLRSGLNASDQQIMRSSIATGDPMREILRVIDDENPSLVLMGSQGRGFIPELFIGSVSFNVVRKATCPVMLIPAERN